MRMFLLFLFAAASAHSRPSDGAKYDRYVFCLMDSAFTIKARIETGIRSSQDPDTAQVLAAARSITYWQGFKLNSKPIGEVWLAYMPPADPGEIIFVSNTLPAYPLLRLKIDAMCGVCFSQYDVFGSLTVPPDVNVVKTNVMAVGMDDDFRLAGALSDAEKTGIAGKINDYIFQGNKDTTRIYVMKMGNRLDSKDNIRYIAYYATVDGSVSVHSPIPGLWAPETESGSYFNILGRPAESLRRKVILYSRPTR